jgi:hypothetical protein
MQPLPTISNIDPLLVDAMDKQCRASSELAAVADRRDYYLYKPKLAAFLVARDLDLTKAMEMWKGWLEWRETNKPFQTTFDQIKNEYYSGKVSILGRDKQGNIAITFKARRHHPKESSPQHILQFIFYLLEKVEDRTINEGRFQIVFINDREGVSMGNVDTGFLSMAKDLVVKLQNYYPEKVARIYILYPNFLFKTMFAVIKPFLHAKTKDKIKVVDEVHDMTKFFDPDSLSTASGGNLRDPFFDYQSKKDFKGFDSPQFNDIFYFLDRPHLLLPHPTHHPHSHTPHHLHGQAGFVHHHQRHQH